MIRSCWGPSDRIAGRTSRPRTAPPAERSAYNRCVPHVIEHASSGRAKCRGCGRPIAKGELRFGERQPNAFGEGEMTLWFHVTCAAYARPESFLEIAATAGDAPGALIPAVAAISRNDSGRA